MKKDGKPKHSEEKKLLQYQDRMPFWPDQYYEQSNPLARSSLFAMSNKRKTFDRFVAINMVTSGDIQYMGQRLNLFDEEVLLQLLQYTRGHSLIRPIDTTKLSLLNDLGIASGGKSYARLMDSLNRLGSGKIKISTPAILRKLENLLNNPSLSKNIEPLFIEQLEERYRKYVDAIYHALAEGTTFSLTVNLITNSGVDESSGRLIINLDPLLVLLYDGINTTRTNILERRELSPAEKKLLTYINSHAETIFPINLITLHGILGSDRDLKSNTRSFAKTINDALVKLQAIGRIKDGWSIKEGKVMGLCRVPYGEEFEH